MPKRSVLSCGDKILNGRYEILKVIHSSGMSNVYLVSDSNLNKQWCLKEIRKSEAGRDQVEYFSLLQEANIMKSLNHTSIPRITTIEQDGDSIFIIMDYVDGMSVKSWLMRRGKISQDVVVSWMKQITQVVMYLHNRKQPIFYRDMKPDNVMIQGDGNIKLLDFGISVVIKEPGQVIEKALGTDGYAAPEQRRRGNVCDLRSDIYAMGKTMYYMLTGINPSQIPKDTPLRSVREVDSSISIGLEQIVNKCIQENPDDRYQSCEELLYALQNYKTLDTKYRNSIRRKCTTVLILFLSSIFILITSLIPLNLYNNQQEKEYARLTTVAEQSGKAEDYEAVLDVNALTIKPYLGYIDAIKVDGVFTKEEEADLLGYINPNLEELKLQQDYGALAFSMGKLYWFYYQGNSQEEGMITSVKWFEDAKVSGYEPELAEVYYQLGTFKRNISVSVTESADAGMYKDYWDNLIKAKEVDNGELVNLQLNLAISSCISTYAYNLKVDGVTYEELTTEIESLQKYINTYTPSLEKAQTSYDSLVQTVSGLSDKVNSVYGVGGVE